MRDDEAAVGTWDVRKECYAALVNHDAVELCVVIEPRRREDAPADMRLVFADRGWLQSEPGHRLVADLREHAMTERAQRRKSAITLRFHDDVLVELERQLADGEPANMAADDIAAGKSAIVSFVGPNTNKALHVGHMRNIFVGEALASALESAGAEVTRLSVVGDIGRRVCEAMAGYMNSHQGEDPVEAGVAPDCFVELCCRDFASEREGGALGAGDDDPNAEERASVGDLADTLMEEWLAESTETVELWGKMRDWVIGGHESTLARLGITIDGYEFESEAIPRAMELIEEGVDRGVLVREETGGVIYRTGQEEYPLMVLVRDDGFPTEHARLLGVYDRILDGLDDGEEHIEIAGLEWQPAIKVICDLLAELHPGPRNDADVRVYHGALTGLTGEKMGSSTGKVVWINDFLDYLASGPAVAALEQLGCGVTSRLELADILVRGTFLCTPSTRPLAFSQEVLFEGRPGPGWTIAEAWCRAQLARAPHEEDTALARTVVMQSQQYRLSLQRTIEKRDVTSLSRYLLSLAEACMASPSPGPAAAPMMQRVFGSLGFLAGKRAALSA